MIRTARLAACILVALATVVSPNPVAAQQPPPVGAEASAVVGPGVSPDLALVPVDSPEVKRLDASVSAVEAGIRRNAAASARADKEAARLAEEDTAVSAALVDAEALLVTLTQQKEKVGESLREVAVQQYVAGGSASDLDYVIAELSGSDGVQRMRQHEFAVAAVDTLAEEFRRLKGAVADAEDEVARLDSRLRSVRSRADEVAGERQRLSREAERLAAELVAVTADRDSARPLAGVVGADFPLVVLDAYWKAAAASRFIDPSCGVEWWMLAGIGAVESGHGTYGGTSVRADGSLDGSIMGIALDGTNGTQAISTGGDGAPDRAMGPMQFIPSTWKMYASDGNGDGVADPQNMYDATVAAARYLCRASTGLGDEAALRRAYFSYNHADWYVQKVIERAWQYRDTVVFPVPAAEG